MVNWVTPELGTAPYESVSRLEGVMLVDIRALVDRKGNKPEPLLGHIDAALEGLRAGQKVVICCDHGVSRSNAVAAAVLSRHQDISLSEAIRRVLAATDGAEIRLDVIDDAREALGERRANHSNSGKHWLVTGGYGYLGSALVDSCPAGIELIRPHRNELDLLSGAAAIDLMIKDNKISRILHFAAPRVGNTNTSLGQALTMLRNVLDVCVSNRIPLLVPSRWEVFSGYDGPEIMVDESTQRSPSGVLGDTKFLIEVLIEEFQKRSHLDVTVLRSGLIYGGGSAPNFMRGFLKRALANDTITTHLYANGSPALDIVRLEDWLTACWSVLRDNLFGIYQCGGGQSISTAEIAQIVAEAVQSKSELRQIEVGGNAPAITFSSEKLNSATAWTPGMAPAPGVAAYAKQAGAHLSSNGG